MIKARRRTKRTDIASKAAAFEIKAPDDTSDFKLIDLAKRLNGVLAEFTRYDAKSGDDIEPIMQGFYNVLWDIMAERPMTQVGLAVMARASLLEFDLFGRHDKTENPGRHPAHGVGGDTDARGGCAPNRMARYRGSESRNRLITHPTLQLACGGGYQRQSRGGLRAALLISHVGAASIHAGRTPYMNWMTYPAYYDLSTRPVRRHPIPTYSEDPDEAPHYHMMVALWEVGEKRREARRRIVAALARRASMRKFTDRDLIKLGVAMAESEARRMLALKVRAALPNATLDEIAATMDRLLPTSARRKPPYKPQIESPPLAP